MHSVYKLTINQAEVNSREKKVYVFVTDMSEFWRPKQWTVV